VLLASARGSTATRTACCQVVEVDDDILEKPADAAGARRMLQRLSNRSHKVHTGDPPLLSQTRAAPPAPCRNQLANK